MRPSWGYRGLIRHMEHLLFYLILKQSLIVLLRLVSDLQILTPRLP